MKYKFKNSIFLTHFLYTILFLLVASIVSLMFSKTAFARERPDNWWKYTPCENEKGQVKWPGKSLEGAFGEREWHPLRPYPTNPCSLPIDPDKHLALLCGKDLYVRDKITVRVPGDELRCDPCKGTPGACGTATCYFVIHRNFAISVDPMQSEYPIAGNTEIVPPDIKERGFIEKIAAHVAAFLGLEKMMRLETWRTGADFSEGSYLPPDINKFVEANDPFQDYYVAYKEWRGKECYYLPIYILGQQIILCWDSPASPNFYAKMFPNVSYSSMEDREGKLRVHDIQIGPLEPETDIEDLITQWPTKPCPRGEPCPDPRQANTANNESVMFFPHMEEDVELTSLLQSTYLPPEIMEEYQEIGPTTPVDIPESCNILDTRWNPGDQLYGEKLDMDPDYHVTYTAIFECEIPCVTIYDIYGNPVGCEPRGTCTRTNWFYSDITTFTPLVDELWSKTVAGNASVFKKVYPQIGLDESPVKEIIDVPSESQIIYDARDLGSDKGTADTDMMTQDPKIYFPHMGGVYDYFIKAIQTILRPQEMPSEPIDLSNDDLAKPPATLNEYVSWYLNGSVYHGQNEPLALKDKDEEEYLEDSYKIINFSGPLNKLLSQHSQWRNYFQASDNPKDLHQDQYEGGKVNQIKERPRIERHNQIEACVLALTLDFPIIGKKDIGGIPFPCSKFTHEFHWWLPSAKSGTGPISGSCDPGTGPCSVENLLPYFGDAQTAKEASIICNCESGSNPSALNDGCLRSTTVDYSVGLFQINALVHCPGAFTGDPYNLPCKVVNQAKLDACVEKWLNPEQNIQKAVQLYNESGWIPWACASTCGII